MTSCGGLAPRRVRPRGMLRGMRRRGMSRQRGFRSNEWEGQWNCDPPPRSPPEEPDMQTPATEEKWERSRKAGAEYKECLPRTGPSPVHRLPASPSRHPCLCPSASPSPQPRSCLLRPWHRRGRPDLAGERLPRTADRSLATVTQPHQNKTPEHSMSLEKPVSTHSTHLHRPRRPSSQAPRFDPQRAEGTSIPPPAQPQWHSTFTSSPME